MHDLPPRNRSIRIFPFGNVARHATDPPILYLTTLLRDCRDIVISQRTRSRRIRHLSEIWASKLEYAASGWGPIGSEIKAIAYAGNCSTVNPGSDAGLANRGPADTIIAAFETPIGRDG